MITPVSFFYTMDILSRFKPGAYKQTYLSFKIWRL